MRRRLRHSVGHVYARLETTRAVEAVYPPGLQQTGAAFFASLGHENVLGPLQLHSPSMDHVVWRSKCFDLGVREDWLKPSRRTGRRPRFAGLGTIKPA